MAVRFDDPAAWCDALHSSPHPLQPARADMLLAYAKALTQSGRRPNLTALDTVTRVVEVLLRPSLLLAWTMDQAPTHVADVGSGNGFPGIVAAALWPDARVALIERRARKARAVQTLADEAGFAVDVLACDARELSREAPQWLGACELVTLRAVGELGPTTRLAAPLLASGGRLVHWKTEDLDSGERTEGERVANALELVACPDVVQPQLADARLVVFERRSA